MIATTTGCQWKVLVAGEQTDGRFAFVETRQQRRCESPTHVHSREDEVIYVLEGEVAFEVNGQRIDRPAGTCLFLPRCTAHMLVMLTPANWPKFPGATPICTSSSRSSREPPVSEFRLRLHHGNPETHRQHSA